MLACEIHCADARPYPDAPEPKLGERRSGRLRCSLSNDCGHAQACCCISTSDRQRRMRGQAELYNSSARHLRRRAAQLNIEGIELESCGEGEWRSADGLPSSVAEHHGESAGACYIRLEADILRHSAVDGIITTNLSPRENARPTLIVIITSDGKLTLNSFVVDLHTDIFDSLCHHSSSIPDLPRQEKRTIRRKPQDDYLLGRR